MKRPVKICILLALSAVFLFSGIRLAQQLLSWKQAENSQSSALEAALKAQPTAEPQPIVIQPPTEASSQPPAEKPTEAPTEPPTEAPTEPPVDDTVRMLLEMDLEALRAVNPDVLGWICIPDTVISYPLMKAQDNGQYLYQTWDKQPSKYGSIFLECRNSHDFSDFNTLIYGHNMLTPDMFGTLSDYKDQAFFESHPSIYILLDSGVRRYDVFSCYDADVVSDTYRLIFEDDARKQASLDLYTAKSLLTTHLQPQSTDQILTLSTCTGRGTADLRFVVQAVFAQETERAGS